MPYIGNEITQAAFTSVIYTATANQTTFPSSGVLPETAVNQASVLVKINGLLAITDSYTIGSTLVMDAGLDADDKVEIVWMGVPGEIGVPSDNSVNLSKIARSGTSGQVLQSGGSGADVYWGAAIAHASTWVCNDSFTGDADPIGADNGSGGYIGTPTEVEDGYLGYTRVGDAMTQTGGVFTFPATGTYMIQFQSNHSGSGTATISDTTYIVVSTDGGSTWTNASGQYFSCPTTYHARMSTSQQILLNVDNVSNVKVKFTVDVDSSISTTGLGTDGDGRRDTSFNFIKLA